MGCLWQAVAKGLGDWWWDVRFWLEMFSQPHVSRLRFLGDALTYLRILASLAILLLAIPRQMAVETVAVIFALGELTDAFDGMAARTFTYPDDGKVRWWRKYAPVIDQVADIMLGVSYMLYIILCVNFWFGSIVLGVLLAIAIPVQLSRDWIEWRFGKKVRKRVVLVRRLIYVSAIYVVGCFSLWQMNWFRELGFWNIFAVYYLILMTFIVAAMCMKPDRTGEEHTDTPEELREKKRAAREKMEEYRKTEKEYREAEEWMGCL